MKLRIKSFDEEGNIVVDGYINKREMSFLVNYAVNDLLSAGVQFNLDEPYDSGLDDEDAEHQPLRMKFPNVGDLN